MSHRNGRTNSWRYQDPERDIHPAVHRRLRIPVFPIVAVIIAGVIVYTIILLWSPSNDTTYRSEVESPDKSARVVAAMEEAVHDLKRHSEWTVEDLSTDMYNRAKQTGYVTDRAHLSKQAQQKLAKAETIWQSVRSEQIRTSYLIALVGSLLGVIFAVSAGLYAIRTRRVLQEERGLELRRVLNNYVSRRDLETEVVEIIERRYGGRSGQRAQPSQPSQPSTAMHGYDRSSLTELPQSQQPKQDLPDFSQVGVENLADLSELSSRILRIDSKFIDGRCWNAARHFVRLVQDYAENREGFRYLQDLQELVQKKSIINPGSAHEPHLRPLSECLARLQKVVAEDIRKNGPVTPENVSVDDLSNLSRFKRLVEQTAQEESKAIILNLIDLCEHIADGTADREEEKLPINSLLLISPLINANRISRSPCMPKLAQLCDELQEKAKAELSRHTRWRIVHPSAGDEFDPKLHKSLGEIVTHDEAMLSTHRIAECIHAGLQFEAKTVFPAEVKMFVRAQGYSTTSPHEF